MSDEVTQAFATLRRHLPASLRAQGAALEAAWFNGGPLHRRTREPAAPEGVDAADERERLREELGLEAGMRTGAVDELESLRRELWQLINADQLSDQDTLSQLRYQCSLVRHWHDRYEQLRARDEAAKAVVDQAELTCAVVKRVLNADASEGTPIWEWTDEEAETGVREVLLAGEELAVALDDVHEGVDLEAQGEMADELTAAQAAIQRVRDLHRRHDDDPGGPPYCAECTSEYAPWPCPTVRALDGDTTGGEH